MKIWVLSTCLPENCSPGIPDVFLDEATALKTFEERMRAEWKHNAPCDDDGNPLAFPDGDPQKANRLMADNGDMWGEWQLTVHSDR